MVDNFLRYQKCHRQFLGMKQVQDDLVLSSRAYVLMVAFRNYVFIKTAYTLNLISRAKICVLEQNFRGQLYQGHKHPILQA